jgi:hypothetical protein
VSTTNFSLSSLNQKPKNNKNKSLYQNEIGIILRDRNFIIYMIVKVGETK